MVTIIFVLHVICCLFLIGLILLQRGQGADIGAAFGGASQTVFGSRGPATFLNKITIAVAVIFLGASIFLAHVARQQETSSVIDDVTKKTSPAPVQDKPIVEEEKTVPPGEGAAEPGKDEKGKTGGTTPEPNKAAPEKPANY